MPITLNHLRGENQTVQQADFGTGDILIMNARDLDGSYENQIWLVQGEPKPKEEWESYKDPNYVEGTITDELPKKDTIVLVFHDRDSIKSLVKSLNELYDKMPAQDSKSEN